MKRFSVQAFFGCVVDNDPAVEIDDIQTLEQYLDSENGDTFIITDRQAGRVYCVTVQQTDSNTKESALMMIDSK